jgi:hypothetical protein
MRRFAVPGAILALLMGGAVVIAAASPSPSPTASASPRASASPTPTATATPSPSGSPSQSPSAHTFMSKVQPLQIAGTATVREAASGAGTIRLRVTGLLDAERWSVDIDGGTIARPNERDEIAFKSGADVTRLATDTVRIHLTKAEMASFLKARAKGGVVAEVSDGTRVGYAAFTAS